MLLAGACVVIAAGVLLRPRPGRPWSSPPWPALAIWIVGENFGAMLTGMATDPNTGPLLILLAAAYWPLRRARRVRRR